MNTDQNISQVETGTTSTQPEIMILGQSSVGRPPITMDMHISSILHEIQIILKNKMDFLRRQRVQIWRWRRLKYPTATIEQKNVWKMKRIVNEFETSHTMRFISAIAACREI